MSHHEVEVKIRIEPEQLRTVRESFLALGFAPAGGRRLEENFLLDFPENSLKQAGCALRLRRYGDTQALTYKGPKVDHPTLKIREEVESSLGDFEATFQILQRLGLSVRFRYAKHREKLHGEFAGETAEICLDETPVGCFVEIESTAETIQALAEALGWSTKDFITRNYIDLYQEQGFGD